MDALGALTLARKKACITAEGLIIPCICPHCKIIETMAIELGIQMAKKSEPENTNQLLIPGVQP